MAYTGAWKARAGVQAGAQKWGTGWNPVHAQRGGEGRNTAPYGSTNLVPEQIIDQYEADDYAGYTTEDSANALWGYNMDTGTADRPPWDMDVSPGDTAVRKRMPARFPRWGIHPGGRPGGTQFRSIEHGDTITYTSKQQPYETVTEGWENKTHGEINDSRTSDPSQYVVNTSMVQRDKTRAGSQTTGRASEYNAPIHSRIVGMRLKPWSGGQRHYDMTPREQSEHIRPWWARNAGTGNVAWMRSNEMYVSDPMQRTPPPNPYAGPVIDDTGTTNTAGYVGEDTIPYV